MGLIRPALFVVSAPSGTGKTSLVKEALASLNFLQLSVSTTTRAQRPGEVEGVDYHFTDPEDFKKSIEKSEFLEWAQVYGNYYGTSKLKIQEQENSGYTVVLDVDVQGAMQLKAIDFKAVYIFITPPSLEELKSRLINRGTETEASLARRLGNAKHELAFQDQYDHVILNDNLELGKDRLLKVFLYHVLDRDKIRELPLAEVILRITGHREHPRIKRLLHEIQLSGGLVL